MKWTFCQVRLKRFPSMELEWRLRISSLNQLLNYESETGKSKVQDAFHNGLAVYGGKKHFTNSLALVANQRSQTKKTSFVMALCDTMGEVTSNQARELEDENILYINSRGGYSVENPENQKYDIFKTVEKEDLIFPETEIRYLQWTQASTAHWYAKIGDKDVVWEDKQKWDTKEQAKEAAEKYLSSITK